MKKLKIFISTFPFALHNPKPLELLEKTGWEITKNTLGRKLKPQEVAEYAKDVDGIIAGTEDLTQLIHRNSNLKIIARVGIGLDSVPLNLCKEKGITVSYTPDAVTMAVVELTIGLMISLTRKVYLADREIRKGGWSRFTGKRLGDSTIGIIGAGRVGLNVIRLLSEFKPKLILINDIKDKSLELEAFKNIGLAYQLVEKEEIYSRSDIVSIHLPLTTKTRNFLSAAELKTFKSDAFLINTARGELVDEFGLYTAIKEGWIAGAAIDVFEDEPYTGKLCELENILLTEHMGSCSYDCRLLMEQGAAEDLIRFFRGQPLKNEVPEEEYSIQE
jgi:D-3-phosphoglycerate dehydrogenase